MLKRLLRIKYQFINGMEDLRDLGAAVENEYSEQQLVKFGLQIIKNTGKFEHDL